MTKKGTKSTKPLTRKQKGFVAEFLQIGNGTQSAIKAGYAKGSARVIACRNLKKENIKEEIQSAAEKLNINAEFVLKNIKRATEISGKTYQKTMGNGDNVVFVEDMVDAPTFLKANDLLGKHLKLFTEQVEVKAQVEIESSDEDKQLIEAARSILFLATKEKN